MIIDINRLVEVYFDRYPRELPKDATYEISRVSSFNSREEWSGDAEVTVNINEDDECLS